MPGYDLIEPLARSLWSPGHASGSSSPGHPSGSSSPGHSSGSSSAAAWSPEQPVDRYLASPSGSPDPYADRVVLSLYPPGAAHSALERARLWQRLDSAHCPQFLDEVDLSQGVAIVTPWLSKGSLSALLERRRLRVGEAVTILAPLAQLLEQLHTMGLAHGDVSARNVYFDDRGAPVLLGWGAAAASSGDAAPSLSEAATLRVDAPPFDLDLRMFVDLTRQVLARCALDSKRAQEFLTSELTAATADTTTLAAAAADGSALFFRRAELALFDLAEAKPIDPLVPYDWGAESLEALARVDAAVRNDVEHEIVARSTRARVRRARGVLVRSVVALPATLRTASARVRQAAGVPLLPGSRSRVRLKTLGIAATVCTVAVTGALVATPQAPPGPQPVSASQPLSASQPQSASQSPSAQQLSNGAPATGSSSQSLPQATATGSPAGAATETAGPASSPQQTPTSAPGVDTTQAVPSGAAANQSPSSGAASGQSTSSSEVAAQPATPSGATSSEQSASASTAPEADAPSAETSPGQPQSLAADPPSDAADTTAPPSAPPAVSDTTGASGTAGTAGEPSGGAIPAGPGTGESELAAAVSSDDPAAAIAALLERRNRCFHQQSAACFDGVDQAQSPALAADEQAFGETLRAGAPPLAISASAGSDSAVGSNGSAGADAGAGGGEAGVTIQRVGDAAVARVWVTEGAQAGSTGTVSVRPPLAPESAASAALMPQPLSDQLLQAALHTGGAGSSTPSGSTPDGSTPDGSTPGGSTPDGSTPGGSSPDGTSGAERKQPASALVVKGETGWRIRVVFIPAG